MEAIVFGMAAAAPWAFGAVDPVFELCLYVGIALLLALWGVRWVYDGQVQILNCPVTLCLATLFLVCLFQLIPLPSWLLTAVSPGTGTLYSRLYPDTAEVLAGQTIGDPGVWRTLSVDPLATRTEAVRWLAVLCLFAVVRNQATSTESLKRFAWGMVLNGVLLSLLGIAQVMRPTKHSIYWHFITGGQFFGPFINRNHYTYYINLCIGLGVGLLIAYGRTEGEKRAGRVYKANALAEQNDAEKPSFSLLAILQSPVQVWLCAMLGVMLAGVAFSLSRGGMVALGVASMVAVGWRVGWPPKRLQIELLIAPLIVVGFFIVWLGGGAIETRVGTLWRTNLLYDGRTAIWGNVASLLPRFGLWGSGAGTTALVEPIGRQADYPAIANTIVEHVHNDYLEAWLEGGIPRLLFTLLFVGLMLRYGIKAIRRHNDKLAGHLALGCLIGILAVVVQSVVEFGLSTPAVAVLAIIVAAQMCSLSRSSPQYPPSSGSKHMMEFGGRLGSVAGLVGALAVGLLLVLTGRQTDLVQRYRIAAREAMTKQRPPNPDDALIYLNAAARVQPGNAQTQLDLAQLHLDMRKPGSAADAGHLAQALRHLCSARNLSPLLPQPHVRLAGNAERFDRADPPPKYYERAAYLMPYDADLPYFAGLYDLTHGDPGSAWAKWRKSLELDGQRLPDIQDTATAKLGLANFLAQVMPESPSLLLRAVRRLPTDGPEATWRPIAEKGLALLVARGPTLTSSECYERAAFHRLLGDTEQTLRYYRLATESLEGSRNEPLRYELAEYLYEQGMLDEARMQLEILLAINRRHGPGLDLQSVVAREMKLRDER